MNRHRLYYAYRCRRCGRGQQRGSSAKWCNLPFPGTTVPCRGALITVSRTPKVKLQLAKVSS